MAAFGRYELVEVLGQGGFATVHRAHDPVLDRDLAIKVLHGYLAGDDQVAERFVREGRALARIRHANLVQVYDAGTIDNQTFLAMEFVAGKSLAALSAGRQMPVVEAARIVEQIAGAIDAVHAVGLIHRDIKPANIIVEPGGRAVLLDLGIARDMENTGLTATGLVVGTPGFLAPEQVDSSVFVGPRTDVYQLAATAYTLLAGKPPYEGDTAQVLYSVAHKPPPDLGATRPDLPYHTIAAVTRALAKDPAERPESATAFASALRGSGPLDDPNATLVASAAAQPTAATAVPADVTRAASTGSEPVAVSAETSLEEPTRAASQPVATARPATGPGAAPLAGEGGKKSRTPVLVGLGIVAAVVAGIAAFALLGGGDDPQAAEDDDETPSASTGPVDNGDFEASGEPTSLSIDWEESTRFAFRAPASLLVSFVVEEAAVGAYYQILDERGREVGDARWISADGGILEPVKLPAPGLYQLEVKPQDEEGGDLLITMYEVPAPDPVAIAPGGEPVALSVTVPGATGLATFEGSVGQRLSISAYGSTKGYYLRVQSTGVPVIEAQRNVWISEGDSFVDAFEIEKAGTYNIIIDPDSSSLVETSIHLFSPEADQTTPLTAGTTANFSLRQPGENAHFTFTGKRDQVISIRVARIENGSNVALRRVSNRQSVDSTWAPAPDGALMVLTLPVDDDYILTVDPDEADLESGTVTLFDISQDVSATAQLGASVTVSTNAPGQKAVINFRSSGGETVTLHSKRADHSFATVVGPGGTEVLKRRWFSGDSSLKLVGALAAGDHMLILEPDGMDPVIYTFEFATD